MNDNQLGVLLEEIRDQNQTVLEAVGDMKKQISNLPTRDEFTLLAEDVKTIKAAAADTSRQVQDHEHRLDALESASNLA